MSPLLSSLLDCDITPSLFDDPDRGPLLAALLIAFPNYDPAARHILSTRAFRAEAPLYEIAALASLEDDTIDAAIDAALSRNTHTDAILEALYRAGIAWEASTLSVLTASGNPFAAAHLAMADNTALFDALTDIEDTNTLIEVLRLSTLSSKPEFLHDELLDWRLELGEDIELRDRVRLDGLLLALNPHHYARHILRGDFDVEFLGDDQPVSDVLTYRGSNDWVDSLAIFRTVRDRNGFELAAAFAVAASLTDSFDDIDDETLQETPIADWMHQHPDRVAFHLAIDEDQTLVELLIEATIHQALLERELQPLPMPGLPLSAGPLPTDEIPKAFELLGTPEETSGRVALVRTLTDLRRHLRLGLLDASDVEELLQDLAQSSSDAIAQLAQDLLTPGSFENHQDWGARGLFFLQESLLESPTTALRRLARGLFFGPPERAGIFRAALEVIPFQ